MHGSTSQMPGYSSFGLGVLLCFRCGMLDAGFPHSGQGGRMSVSFLTVVSDALSLSLSLSLSLFLSLCCCVPELKALAGEGSAVLLACFQNLLELRASFFWWAYTPSPKPYRREICESAGVKFRRSERCMRCSRCCPEYLQPRGPGSEVAAMLDPSPKP